MDECCDKLRMPIVTWETIRVKSEKIRCVIVKDAEHASNSNLINMVFSDGWIQKLHERHSLKSRHIYDRAVSCMSSELPSVATTLERKNQDSENAGEASII